MAEFTEMCTVCHWPWLVSSVTYCNPILFTVGNFVNAMAYVKNIKENTRSCIFGSNIRFKWFSYDSKTSGLVLSWKLYLMLLPWFYHFMYWMKNMSH